MSRSRFASAVQSGSRGNQQPSISEALWFDFRSAENWEEDSLAAWRVGAFNHVPLLMGATHLLVGATSLTLHFREELARPLTSPILAILLILLLDLAAGLMIHWRKRLDLAPHTTIRFLCAYFLLAGGLWIVFGSAVMGQSHIGHETAVPVAIGAGITATAIVSANSPPVAIVNMIVAVVGALLFGHSLMVTCGLFTLCAMLVAFSVANARTVMVAGRKRLALDAEARKTLHFVDEFENSGRGWFWETNAEATLSYVSRQLADDFGCEPEALLGRQFTDLLSVDSDPANPFGEESKTLGFHLSARFPFSDVVVRPASEQDVHWSLSGNPIFDDRGRFLGFRGIGTDLTEQRRSEQEISRLARFDSLTSLPNRAMMRQTLEEALRNAARRQKGCALFLIDLDRFKNVNDTLGHPVGDALLRLVAERLKSVVGEQGQVGRLGGDEFKAVFPGLVDVSVLESLARTLIDQVSRPYAIEGHRVTIGASVGVAIGDPGRGCADSLIRNADLALYAAKAAGRGKHCLYEPSMHSEATDRQALENDLRQAIERGELSVVYQPIVRAAGEEIAGFEALVRWTHPVRGQISPDKFIPLAEECGLIGSIGGWVLRTAVAEAANWPDHLRVAVNLSPIQFNDPGIVDAVADILKQTGVRSEQVELEITEGVFIGEGDLTDETFARLKSLGVRLALDDFGTGYSSLGYLKKAPFDKIKIDQSFVRGAASRSTRNAAIIRAIVTLAESLGMDTCAEGVETHDDLHLIRELGCSQVQGYIFGRPVPAETARELANRERVEADGYQYVREPRHRLMRRAIAVIGGEPTEIRMRNISAQGALAECIRPLAPGTQLTIDIVGVGPVMGTVRWAQAGRFGLQFNEAFDLARLAPKRERLNPVTMLRPLYIDKREAS
jgi:diguanylate cyclase (GGDEF)-like protein